MVCHNTTESKNKKGPMYKPRWRANPHTRSRGIHRGVNHRRALFTVSTAPKLKAAA